MTQTLTVTQRTGQLSRTQPLVAPMMTKTGLGESAESLSRTHDDQILAEYIDHLLATRSASSSRQATTSSNPVRSSMQPPQPPVPADYTANIRASVHLCALHRS